MRHLTLLAIAVAVVTACGTAAAITPTTEGLAGRAFWSTAIQGRDLVPDTRVRLVFNADGSVGASAGCNSMGGTWSLDGTTLRIRIEQMTEMGCPDDRFAQDDWLIDWLSGELTVTLRGDELVLSGADVTMTLLDRETADADPPAEGS
jgi:heat shock protein HslJ